MKGGSREQAEIDLLRADALRARARLLQAIEDACPGPHQIRHYRIGFKTYCPTCRRTDWGERQ